MLSQGYDNTVPRPLSLGVPHCQVLTPASIVFARAANNHVGQICPMSVARSNFFYHWEAFKMIYRSIVGPHTGDFRPTSGEVQVALLALM
jgi:hypothetical protein